ncbi:RAD51-associated protein 1 isoform X2 [Nothoprocta perdicaria]|uniref:RAD51-associated protein 1 isoform X2 n=1 Tax=Nothoprocta perdicaria TaxID=30464 RepID=UPI000E1B96C2|nr:RAD51-associated protein 1 isoform X2 [Nothoprocta perdicaria]
MAQPVRRNKKTVDYSELGDLYNDDEDFAYVAVPLSKKSRTQLKELKREKKEKQKKLHRKLTPSHKEMPGKRISLDDKLYQRDLEVALALSVKETSANVCEVQNSEEKGPITGKNIKSENVHGRPVFSNCVTESELLGEESEEDSVYSEDDDEDFAMKKKKAKDNKKETKQKKQAEREKENSKSNIKTRKLKSETTQKMMSTSTEPVGRPLCTSSPVRYKKPKWIPPAASGSSNNSVKYVSIKSPTQCLRLGLSRLARVKPLHPSTASS